MIKKTKFGILAFFLIFININLFFVNSCSGIYTNYNFTFPVDSTMFDLDDYTVLDNLDYVDEFSGYYNATWQFDNENDVDEWDDELNNKIYDPWAESPLYDDIYDDHAGVMRIRVHCRASDTFETQSNGSIDFWFHDTEATNDFFFYVIDEDDNNLFEMKLWLDCEYIWLNGTHIANYTDGEWNHFQFNIFDNLTIYLNGNIIFNEVNNAQNGFCKCLFYNLSYYVYIDAVGYSWDAYYKVGQNKFPYLMESESLKLKGYNFRLGSNYSSPNSYGDWVNGTDGLYILSTGSNYNVSLIENNSLLIDSTNEYVVSLMSSDFEFSNLNSYYCVNFDINLPKDCSMVMLISDRGDFEGAFNGTAISIEQYNADSSIYYLTIMRYSNDGNLNLDSLTINTSDDHFEVNYYIFQNYYHAIVVNDGISYHFYGNLSLNCNFYDFDIFNTYFLFSGKISYFNGFGVWENETALFNSFGYWEITNEFLEDQDQLYVFVDGIGTLLSCDPNFELLSNYAVLLNFSEYSNEDSYLINDFVGNSLTFITNNSINLLDFVSDTIRLYKNNFLECFSDDDSSENSHNDSYFYVYNDILYSKCYQQNISGNELGIYFDIDDLDATGYQIKISQFFTNSLDFDVIFKIFYLDQSTDTIQTQSTSGANYYLNLIDYKVIIGIGIYIDPHDDVENDTYCTACMSGFSLNYIAETASWEGEGIFGMLTPLILIIVPTLIMYGAIESRAKGMGKNLILPLMMIFTTILFYSGSLPIWLFFTSMLSLGITILFTRGRNDND